MGGSGRMAQRLASSYRADDLHLAARRRRATAAEAHTATLQAADQLRPEAPATAERSMARAMLAALRRFLPRLA